jgi:hypothetical protein
MDKETGYLNRVLQTLLVGRLGYKSTVNYLKEDFRKVMGIPLHLCFVYPNNFEGFVEDQKATFVIEGDVISLTPEVIKNLSKVKEKDNVISLISDDEEAGNNVQEKDVQMESEPVRMEKDVQIESEPVRMEKEVKVEQEKNDEIINKIVDNDDYEIDYGDNY